MEWGKRGELLTERDVLGQSLTARLPDGSEQHWRWSEAGQLLASVSANPQGQSNDDQRRYTYNPLGQLLRQVEQAETSEEPMRWRSLPHDTAVLQKQE